MFIFYLFRYARIWVGYKNKIYFCSINLVKNIYELSLFICEHIYTATNPTHS